MTVLKSIAKTGYITLTPKRVKTLYKYYFKINKVLGPSILFHFLLFLKRFVPKMKNKPIEVNNQKPSSSSNCRWRQRYNHSINLYNIKQSSSNTGSQFKCFYKYICYLQHRYCQYSSLMNLD